MHIDDRDGIRVLHVDVEGPTISSSEQTSDLVGNAWFDGVDVIALPVSRIDPEFFRLESRFAGEFLQKVVNYQLQLAVIGDIRAFASASGAFRDFVWETNRGEQVWFLPDLESLDAKLASRRKGNGLRASRG